MLDTYLGGRLDAQMAWLRRRAQEARAAELQGARLRTLFLTIATVAGAISPAVPDEIRPWLGVAATAATAVATVIAGWLSLQAFARRSRLADDFSARIGVIVATRPLQVGPTVAAHFVGSCEELLSNEAVMWGTVGKS